MGRVEFHRDATLKFDAHKIRGAIHAIDVSGVEFSAPSRDFETVPPAGSEGLLRIEILPSWIRAAMSLGEASGESSLWSAALTGDESEEHLTLRCRVEAVEERSRLLRRPHTFLSLEFIHVGPPARDRLEAIVSEADSSDD